MTSLYKSSAVAALLSLTLGAGSALAKAHDQGVADGEPLAFEGTTGEFVNNVVPGPGIQVVVSDGIRGDSAATSQGDNRVEPVVGNGANVEPD